MTVPTPRSVVSGKPYAVHHVQGRSPGRLGDFAGETCFGIDLDGEDYTVWGPGVDNGEHVRVYEKTEQGAGKDVRVWLVHAGGDGEPFTATHGGADIPHVAASPQGPRLIS